MLSFWILLGYFGMRLICLSEMTPFFLIKCQWTRYNANFEIYSSVYILWFPFLQDLCFLKLLLLLIQELNSMDNFFLKYLGRWHDKIQTSELSGRFTSFPFYYLMCFKNRWILSDSLNPWEKKKKKMKPKGSHWVVFGPRG